MNWEAIGAVGELVGALAVFATLAYLAVQVRQSKLLLERNEKIALSQVHQARTDTRLSLHYAHLNSPHLGALSGLWDHPEAVDGLSNDELEHARTLMMVAVTINDNALYQHSLELLDAETLAAATNLILRNYPVWQKLGVPVTPRIEKCYQDALANAADFQP